MKDGFLDMDHDSYTSESDGARTTCDSVYSISDDSVSTYNEDNHVTIPGLAHVHYPLTAPIQISVLEVIHLHCYLNLKFHLLDQIVHHYKVLFMTGINIRTCLFTVRHGTNQIMYHPVSHQTNQIIHHQIQVCI